MRTFFLDLASGHGSIACVDGAVRALRSVDKKISDAELLPSAEGTLEKAGWTWEGIGRIACAVGPGGFMSLRVACAFVNALAWERGIPLAGIHLSDLCAARAANADALWVHSTKRAEVFARGFGAHARLWPEATHLPLEDFLARVPRDTPLIGELIPEHAALLEEKGCVLQESHPLEDVLPEFLGGLEYARGQVTPWYGREG